TARLIEVCIVWPAIERCEALRTGAGPATAVTDAVCAGTVPRHADEERSIVPVVRRPPRLRVRHQGIEVLDDRLEIESLELLGVVEFRTHRVREGRVLMQDFQVELVGPPIGI